MVAISCASAVAVAVEILAILFSVVLWGAMWLGLATFILFLGGRFRWVVKDTPRGGG